MPKLRGSIADRGIAVSPYPLLRCSILTGCNLRSLLVLDVHAFVEILSLYLSASALNLPRQPDTTAWQCQIASPGAKGLSKTPHDALGKTRKAHSASLRALSVGPFLAVFSHPLILTSLSAAKSQDVQAKDHLALTAEDSISNAHTRLSLTGKILGHP